MRSETDLYARALRQRWWLVVAVAVVAVATSRFFTMRETRLYGATASAMVTPAASITEHTELLRALETLERRTVVATLALLPTSRETREAAAMMARVSPAALPHHRISASVVPNTNVLRVRVEGPDPDRASALANAIVQVTATRANELYRLFALQPLDPSLPSPRPIHPNATRNLAVAGILGLFLGLALTVGIELAYSLVARAPRGEAEPRTVLRSA